MGPDELYHRKRRCDADYGLAFRPNWLTQSVPGCGSRVYTRINALRDIDQPYRNGHFQDIPGHMRCFHWSTVSDHSAGYKQAVRRTARNVHVGHGHYDSAYFRPDDWRLVDRELQLALGVLHQLTHRHSDCGYPLVAASIAPH